MRLATNVLVGSMILFSAATAAAQNSGKAEALFKQGRALMDEGKLAEACARFAASYAEEPVVSTLLNLGNCREKNGQYASAYDAFVAAERMTRGKPDQATFNNTAATRAAGLEARLSYLNINVPDDSRVDGLQITRNGEPVDAGSWNLDIPVDGGEYKIEGKAPAYEAWSTTVTIAPEKDKKSVNVPRFRELPAGAQPGGAAPADGGERPSSFTGKRKAAVGLWIAGAAGLGAGAYLEYSARSTYEDSEREPDDTRQKELYDSANQKRLFGTIAAGVGAAAIGAGVYLWVTGKPSLETAGVSWAPQLGPDLAGFAASGTF